MYVNNAFKRWKRYAGVLTNNLLLNNIVGVFYLFFPWHSSVKHCRQRWTTSIQPWHL